MNGATCCKKRQLTASCGPVRLPDELHREDGQFRCRMLNGMVIEVHVRGPRASGMAGINGKAVIFGGDEHARSVNRGWVDCLRDGHFSHGSAPRQSEDLMPDKPHDRLDPEALLTC